MPYTIRTLSEFDKDVKRLAKKHRSLGGDLHDLFDSLQAHPTQGTPIGKGCYKIRMAISSKGQGKSGGARVITYVKVTAEQVILLTIYDKSEKGDLEPNELEALLAQLPDDATDES